MLLNRLPSQLFKSTLKSNSIINLTCVKCSDFSKPDIGRFNIIKKCIYGFIFSGVVVTSYYARQAIEKKSEILKEAIRLNNKIGRMTLYKFRDFILPEEVLPVIKELPEIKFNSDDVILSTFPKTGNYTSSPLFI